MRNTLILLALAVFAFLAFKAPETEQSSDSEFAPVTSGAVLKSWSLDTITNAELDTLNLSEILASPYQYAYQIKLANISGTRNVKFYLDQTCAKGTRYMTVDSAITSGTTVNYYLMKGANTWGYRHRIRVVGAGTQSTSYLVDGLLKKTN